MSAGPERWAYGPNLALPEHGGIVTVSREPRSGRMEALNDGARPYGHRFNEDDGLVPVGACVWGGQGTVRAQIAWPRAQAINEVVVSMPALPGRPQPERTIERLTLEYRDRVTGRWLPAPTIDGGSNPTLMWVLPVTTDGTEERAFALETVTTDAVRVTLEASRQCWLAEIEAYRRREPILPFAMQPTPGPADAVLEPGDPCRVAVHVTDSAGLAVANHPVTFETAQVPTDRAGRAAARVETSSDVGVSAHRAVTDLASPAAVEVEVRTHSRADALSVALGWLERAATALQHGCRMAAFDGTVMYTPDGVASYAGFWVRDFQYMVEGHPSGIPPTDVRAGFEYLITRQREDGAMPNKVRGDGMPVYCPGPGCDGVFGPLPPPDNPSFMVKLVYHYHRLTGDLSLFAEHAERLVKGMEFVPRNPDTALVHIPPERPSSPYGFTDAVAKTGDQLFDSLLYLEAATKLAGLFEQLGDTRSARRWAVEASRVRGGIQTLHDRGSGMFLAASVDCRQIDVWGSAYAACIGAISDEQRRGVARYLRENYEGVVRCGQVRHVAPGEHWQRTIVPHVGVYQNGPYWAIASGWVATVIGTIDRELAERMLLDLVRDYQEHGINEAIDPDSGYVAIPRYVASATNPIPTLGALARGARERRAA